jgi:hypothetical protein
VSKDYRKIQKAINREPGWETRTGKGGHAKIFRNGVFTGISIPNSGSAQRNIRNDLAALKREGLSV